MILLNLWFKIYFC